MSSVDEVILGYWPTRGRGGTIRNLLSYCGIPFTNKLYFDDPSWFLKDKKNINLDYPNLPYLIDGKKRITESIAIMYYIAMKSNRRDLIGDTDEKFIQVKTALGVTSELRNELTKLIWTKGDFEEEREDAFNWGPIFNKLDVLNKNMEGKKWLCGFFSLADFDLFENVDLVHEMEAARLAEHPNLLSFRTRFGNLPHNQTHRKSENFRWLWTPPGWGAWRNTKPSDDF